MKTRTLSQEATAEPTNRILPETKVVLGIVLPFLVLAFLILYLRPGETDTRFAWHIRPNLMAMYMGAGYLTGAYFFTRVILGDSWIRVTRGFLPVASFATTMLLLTILHWDRFTMGHYATYIWAAVYAVTPLLVIVVWLRNRSQDPGVLEPGDKRVLKISGVIMTLIGVALTALAVIGFIVPDLLITIWPWTLTALTARVMSGWLLFLGVGGLVIGREERWSAWQIPLQSIAFWQILLLAAIATRTEDFRSNFHLLSFTASVLIILGGIVALYIYMMRRPVEEA